MHVSLVRRICFVGGTRRSPECIAVKLNHGIALECRKEKCRVNYFFFFTFFHENSAALHLRSQEIDRVSIEFCYSAGSSIFIQIILRHVLFMHNGHVHMEK